MKPKLLLLILLSITIYSNAQNVSRQDTQDWIIHKIEDNAKDYTYKVTFSNSTIKIETATINYNTSFVEFGILDIKSIQLRSFSNSSRLIFYFKPNAKVVWNNSYDYSSNEKYEITVTKDYQENDLLDRTRNAFNRMIEICGGDPIKYIEAF